MKIIKINANEKGARPPLQEWRDKIPPSGYAWCPDDLAAFFVSCMGFVHIVVEGDTVAEMTANEEARAEYIAGLPDPVEPTETEPSAEEILDIMLGVTL